MELKIGQRWRTRGGAIAYVHGRNDGRASPVTRFPWVARYYPSGTDSEPVYHTVSNIGRVYDWGVDRNDLFELLDDAPAAVVPDLGLPTISWPSLDLPSAAGDSHEATTFHPLPTPSLDALAGITEDPGTLLRAALNLPTEPGLAINPKDAIGATKLPLHLWPAEATALGCLGMLEGALKYGRANFIGGEGVIASIYIDAACRHLLAWFEGEENAHDTGTPHLANALATIAIVVKCIAHKKLIDDRNYGTLPDGARYRAFVEDLTPHVKRLKQMFADKNPKHFTIGDVKVERKKADDTEGGAL